MDNIWSWLLLCSAITNSAGAVVMYTIMLRLKKRQQLAYKGDRDAANHLVLPCYMPMFLGVVALFGAMAVTFFVIFLVVSGPFYLIQIIQYQLLLWCCLFLIVPILFTQKSISPSSRQCVFVRLLPWFLVSSALWVASTASVNEEIRSILQIIVLFVVSVFPMAFCIMLISKVIWCRVKFGSASNRACILHLLAFSILYMIFNICYILRDRSQAFEIIMAICIGALFCVVINFPVTLYRTFLADTKFWRGLGQHNRGGFRKSASQSMVRNSATGSHLNLNFDEEEQDRNSNAQESEMNVATASNQFQEMMNDISDVMIDFAFIELGPVIGHGASADVLFGHYQSKDVAIKVSAPPEITEEVLTSFYGEALITSSLDHPNIVKFYGICVKPPEIGMVIEFCSHGNLKGSLARDPSMWTLQRKLHGALHAARAVEYLHSKSVIHRDIKADNFFVDDEWNVKLGDFGESVFKKRYGPGRRMTVLGTVAFMAPELVEGKPVYTEAIDVYALGMTLWEIWTGHDPFDDTSTFSIYSKVMGGERPPVPADAPIDYVNIMCLAWDQDPGMRPTAHEMVLALEKIVSSSTDGVTAQTTPLDKVYTDAIRQNSTDIESGVELSDRNPLHGSKDHSV
jgi:serine/threonine protein kinase